MFLVITAAMAEQIGLPPEFAKTGEDPIDYATRRLGQFHLEGVDVRTRLVLVFGVNDRIVKMFDEVGEFEVRGLRAWVTVNTVFSFDTVAPTAPPQPEAAPSTVLPPPPAPFS